MRSMFIGLLAAAPAVLALEARQAAQTTTTLGPPSSTSTDAFADCTTVLASLLDVITAVPTLTGAAGSFVSSVSGIDDPCSILSAAPSSLQPEISSYLSHVASDVQAKPELVTKVSSCAADPDLKTIIDPILHVTACTGAPTGSRTKNAGPRETGAIAMGAAVVAVVGAIGML